MALTFRLKIRHELFILRDRLHKIKLEKLSKEDQEIVGLIESSINNILDRMIYINLINIIRLYSIYESDKELRKIINNFNEKIKNSNNSGIKHIDNQLTLLIGKALVVNVGALLVYLMPVFIASRIVSSIYREIRLWIEKNSQGFLLTPNSTYSHLSISY